MEMEVSTQKSPPPHSLPLRLGVGASASAVLPQLFWSVFLAVSHSPSHLLHAAPRAVVHSRGPTKSAHTAHWLEPGESSRYLPSRGFPSSEKADINQMEIPINYELRIIIKLMEDRFWEPREWAARGLYSVLEVS